MKSFTWVKPLVDRYLMVAVQGLGLGLFTIGAFLIWRPLGFLTLGAILVIAPQMVEDTDPPALEVTRVAPEDS